MKILGIETSCDETSASVVEDGREVFSNVVSSSLKDHRKYGGIIPEIASRRQLELIHTVVREALEEAEQQKRVSLRGAFFATKQSNKLSGGKKDCFAPLRSARNDTNNLSGSTLDSIDAIAVTQSPGLIGSLLVGVSFARALAFALKKPLIEVDHIKAHLYANFLRLNTAGGSQCHCESHRSLVGRSNLFNPKEIASSLKSTPRNDTCSDSFLEFLSLPAIGLVVSGGHSNLFHVKDFNHCILLGQTRDDAAGEAYDKVARILGLSYPGGPVLDRLAKEGANKQIRFPSADLPDTFDFSFSGVKTAVLVHLKKNKASDESSVKRIAYAFQESVVSVLVEKSIAACKKKKLKTLLIGGGVAANSALRQKLQWRGREEEINVFFPPLSLCMDNAAMIAGLAYHLMKSKD